MLERTMVRAGTEERTYICEKEKLKIHHKIVRFGWHTHTSTSINGVIVDQCLNLDTLNRNIINQKMKRRKNNNPNLHEHIQTYEACTQRKLLVGQMGKLQYILIIIHHRNLSFSRFSIACDSVSSK